LREWDDRRSTGNVSEEQALQVGLEEKAKEFVEKGAELYANR
jgi:hypothetical protein